MSGGADFLDTNVFVYLVDARAPAKQAIAKSLVGQALSEGSGVISHQVVQETLHVLGSKFRVATTRADREDMMREVLMPMWQVQPSEALYRAAIEVQERQGFGFYDSLIVAAALQSGCKRLLSDDLQHGQRIGKLRIENPFA